MLSTQLEELTVSVSEGEVWCTSSFLTDSFIKMTEVNLVTGKTRVKTVPLATNADMIGFPL